MFIAQSLLLRYAAVQPALSRSPDNVLIFEAMAAGGIMPEPEAAELTTTYVTLRDALHHLALQSLPGHVDPELFLPQREIVSHSWQHWLEQPLE